MLIVAYYVVLTILLLWLLGNLFTYPLQDYFIFRPKRLEQNYAFSFNRSPEEVFIHTPHHGRINALHFRVDGTPRGVILFFHGNSDNIARWGHLYHFFGQFNYDYFVYDYRGYGKSTGRRNEHTMQLDAEAVFTYLKQQYPSEKIILFGRSLGSAFASKIAAENIVKALILETPFSSMRNLFYTYYPFLPKLFVFKYVFPNRRYLRHVQSPIYIFQGTKDWVVPYTCAARLKSSLKLDDAFITIPGGGHNNLIFYDIYNQKMREIIA